MTIAAAEITPMPVISGSTKHENPPLPPFGKGGMGGFSYKKMKKCWPSLKKLQLDLITPL